MPVTFINYWYFGRNGKLLDSERMPKSGSLYVFEIEEKHSELVSRHTFFSPQSGETRKFDAVSEEDRMVKRREIVREMLANNK